MFNFKTYIHHVGFFYIFANQKVVTTYSSQTRTMALHKDENKRITF